MPIRPIMTDLSKITQMPFFCSKWLVWGMWKSCSDPRWNSRAKKRGCSPATPPLNVTVRRLWRRAACYSALSSSGFSPLLIFTRSTSFTISSIVLFTNLR